MAGSGKLVRATASPAFAAAVLIATSAPAFACGDDPAGADSPLLAYVEALDDPRLDVREEATQRLISDTAISREAIDMFLREQWETLAPEALERFLLAARERYVANPGAIGIQFGEAATAVIQVVREEAPAAMVLQPGDQFLSLNGIILPEARFEQQTELRRIMSELKAGDMVHARIRRGLRELEVSFALADPARLPQFEEYVASMKREMLDAWHVRRRSIFPAPAKLLIDLRVREAGAVEGDSGSANTWTDSTAVVEELRDRISRVSASIARVAEQTAGADDPVRRRELEREYLALRDELFGLNARLRLVDPTTAGRPRR